MINRFFLYRIIHWSFLLGIFFSLLAGWKSFLILLVLIYLLLLYMFRKARIKHRDQLRKSYDTVMTPINGYVTSVSKNSDHQYLIKMKQGLLDSYSVNLPVSSELQNRSESIHEKLNHFLKKYQQKSSTALTLQTPSRVMITMKIYQSFLGIMPRVWIITGDRGRVAAGIGFIPLGGEVELVLPAASKVLAKKGDRLLIGETVIASISE